MTEIARRAAFERIRYAQLWEDADILLEALDVRPGDTCVSIASAGDNALAMLSRSPAKVYAVDLNPAQLACVELRRAALGKLTREEWLRLAGSRPCEARGALLDRCLEAESAELAAFWRTQDGVAARGVAGVGKFENFFRLFRTRVMPLIHCRATVEALLAGARTREERERFYEERWNNARWRALFRVFFSRFVMGRLGRDPEFFRFVEGDVASRILERTRHALVELNPAENPYLNWILSGAHGEALPYAWREGHYEAAAGNRDALECRLESLESLLDSLPPRSVHRFNLSDIFEYMSPAGYEAALESILRAAAPGARLVYWNMLVPRRRPVRFADRLISHDALSRRLHAADKAFFYSDLVIEEVRA